MNIPIIALFVPYSIFLVFITIRMIANMYHVLRYAFLHRASLIMASLFLAAMLLVIAGTAQALSNTPWNSSVRVTVPTGLLQPSQEALP